MYVLIVDTATDQKYVHCFHYFYCAVVVSECLQAGMYLCVSC